MQATPAPPGIAAAPGEAGNRRSRWDRNPQRRREDGVGYQRGGDEVLRLFEVDPRSRLTTEEAVRRQPKFEFNRITQRSLCNESRLTHEVGVRGRRVPFASTPVRHRLFHSAPIGGESGLRILGVATTGFSAVVIEKRLRCGRVRGDRAFPE